MQAKSDIYERVTAKIIDLLEQNKREPIKRPWVSLTDGQPPRNPISGTIYQGANMVMLSIFAYALKLKYNQWVTFKQAKAVDAKVKKGSKGAEVVYLNYQYFTDEGKVKDQKAAARMTPGQREAKGITKRPFLRGYYVFNIEDVEGLPAEFYDLPELDELTDWQKDEAAERLLTRTGADFRYSEGNEAAYQPSEDYIRLPERHQFQGSEAFYMVAFHELAHWTGHPSRLNRPLTTNYGSREYAHEELIAELTSAFICATMGMERTISQNVNYLDNWIRAMKADKRYIFKVIGDATRAADYIREAESGTLAQAA